ncbi:MAG: nuclear transport factor 2 family protein [Pyrinomonadaceae bacterium]
MKSILMVLIIGIAASSAAFAQEKMAKGTNSSVETQIIALEKASWEEWKNKNASWFQTYLTDDALNINGSAVSNKSQIVKSTGSDCEVKSYSVDNFQFVMLDKNAALITYTATQDGVCSEKALPASVRASSVYVKRGGKWLNALYMETPTVQ